MKTENECTIYEEMRTPDEHQLTKEQLKRIENLERQKLKHQYNINKLTDEQNKVRLGEKK